MVNIFILVRNDGAIINQKSSTTDVSEDFNFEKIYLFLNYLR
jgi:hypothetical protein